MLKFVLFGDELSGLSPTLQKSQHISLRSEKLRVAGPRLSFGSPVRRLSSGPGPGLQYWLAGRGGRSKSSPAAVATAAMARDAAPLGPARVLRAREGAARQRPGSSRPCRGDPMGVRPGPDPRHHRCAVRITCSATSDWPGQLDVRRPRGHWHSSVRGCGRLGPPDSRARAASESATGTVPPGPLKKMIAATEPEGGPVLGPGPARGPAELGL